MVPLFSCNIKMGILGILMILCIQLYVVPHSVDALRAHHKFMSYEIQDVMHSLSKGTPDLDARHGLWRKLLQDNAKTAENSSQAQVKMEDQPKPEQQAEIKEVTQTEAAEKEEAKKEEVNHIQVTDEQEPQKEQQFLQEAKHDEKVAAQSAGGGENAGNRKAVQENKQDEAKKLDDAAAQSKAEGANMPGGNGKEHEEEVKKTETPQEMNGQNGGGTQAASVQEVKQQNPAQQEQNQEPKPEEESMSKQPEKVENREEEPKVPDNNLIESAKQEGNQEKNDKADVQREEWHTESESMKPEDKKEDHQITGESGTEERILEQKEGETGGKTGDGQTNGSGNEVPSEIKMKAKESNLENEQQNKPNENEDKTETKAVDHAVAENDKGAQDSQPDTTVISEHTVAPATKADNSANDSEPKADQSNLDGPKTTEESTEHQDAGESGDKPDIDDSNLDNKVEEQADPAITETVDDGSEKNTATDEPEARTEAQTQEAEVESQLEELKRGNELDAAELGRQDRDPAEDDYSDLMQELADLPSKLQETAGKVADHLRPDVQKWTDTSRVYFNMANQQITESFSPLIGKEYAPFLASTISYALLLLPLIVVIMLFEHIRALLSLQKVLLFINIYLAAYFATLWMASYIIGLEPMSFFYQNALSSYLSLQLLQALGYMVYLILQTANIINACTSDTFMGKLSAVIQWAVAFSVGLHYYVAVFHPAVASKPPRTNWKLYAIYSAAFFILCLCARIRWVKKQYISSGDGLTNKKN